MCGLLSLLSADRDAPDQADAVGHALQCAVHRGPDEGGTWHDPDVVLGFRRLSIIDVDGSHQPLHRGPPDEPGRYSIVFNGEIYNYAQLRVELVEMGAAFATAGDTEGIVAAYHHWGAAAVERLRGMFAFVVWDSRERVLFGARDPFGVKPLFWAAGPTGVAFASEQKSLPALGLGACLDTAALQHHLVLQYVPEPATLHRGIRTDHLGTSTTR